jgi:hypothetical protein
MLKSKVAEDQGFAERSAMQPDRTALLTRLMRDRILVLDGAMGTMIQQHKLSEGDWC